jgi:hypothetical protein
MFVSNFAPAHGNAAGCSDQCAESDWAQDAQFLVVDGKDGVVV